MAVAEVIGDVAYGIAEGLVSKQGLVGGALGAALTGIEAGASAVIKRLGRKKKRSSSMPPEPKRKPGSSDYPFIEPVPYPSKFPAMSGFRDFNNGVGFVNVRSRRSRRVAGRRRRNMRKAAKKAVLTRMVLGHTLPILTNSWSTNYRHILPMGANAGALALVNAGSNQDVNVLPMHIYELVRLPQASTTLSYHLPRTLIQSKAVNDVGQYNYAWVPGLPHYNQIKGTTEDAPEVSSTRDFGGEYQVCVNNSYASMVTGGVVVNRIGQNTYSLGENWSKDDTEAQICANRFHLLKDVDISLQMYGSNRHDTLFRIDLVQFTDDRLQPMSATNTQVFGSTSGEVINSRPEFNSLMAGLMNPYVDNPMTRIQHPRRGFKILRSWKYKLPEQDNSSWERLPCMSTKINIPFGQLMTSVYRATEYEKDLESFDMNGAQNTMGISGVNQFDGQGRPHPRRRYFLLVRATSPHNLAMSTSEEPSVPLSVRMRRKDDGDTSTSDTAYGYICPTYNIDMRIRYVTMNQ